MLILFRSRLSWILALLLPASRIVAATFLAEGYTIRVWQTEDGLPQNMVTSAVQTRDGYLWFGTYNGLARFNGERFQVFDAANTPGLQDRRIACLFEDARGTLWIGHEAGVITRYRDGRFEPFSTPESSREKIIGLGSDAEGKLWAMRQSGSLDLVGDGEHVSSLIAAERPGVMAWTRSPRGNIWLAENGQAARLAEGKLAVAVLDPPRRTNYVLGIAAAASGGAWLLCDSRVRKWEHGRWVEDRGDQPWPDGPLSCSLELRDGTLAVGTIYSGLYLIFADGRRPVHFDRSNGLPQNWVRFLYEDREGDLWAGSGSAGLVSIHPAAFSTLNSPDQWQGCTVLAVAPGQDNALWIGTDGAGLYHFADGKWSHYGENEGLRNWYVPAVTESAEGAVWAGNFWWGGPYRLDRGQFVRPRALDEKSSPVFSLLSVPGSGELLVGTRDGLLRLKGDEATWLIHSPEGAASGITAIARDRQGGLWCGFEQGGLARILGGKLSTYHRQDGLPSDAIQCLSVDDDGALWIGTADRGLSRFRSGHFSNLGVAAGLTDNSICYILDDGLGHFWLSTRHGLQRVAKSDLNLCADGLISTLPSQTYNQDDGLPVIEFTGGLQGAGCKTPDGRLWFASSKGVVSVDPSRIESNPTPPPVVLESMLVDGRSVSLTPGADVHRLAPDHQRLEFRFGGLSFVAPNKVLFKYRLDGIDDAWVDAGSKRTAFYSRLPAGSYRFHVIACNNDGVWNSTGASLAFTVAPFFWQTWWFIGSGLLLAANIIALVVRHFTRRRLQRRIAQMERQHELERERARIAQDIHDDVGASLSRIAMLSQPARSELAEPARASAVLSRIFTAANEVTQTLDEIVWAVDPRHDTLDSLVDYMGRFAQDFLSAAAIRCRLDLPADVPAWPLTAETRHSVFLAFKEALNNIVRHAAATEVRVSFSVRPDSFILTVHDDGHGFTTAAGDGASRPAPGNGLRNMNQRLAQVGGRCEIHSEPGHGTRVTFTAHVPSSTPPRPPPPGTPPRPDSP